MIKLSEFVFQIHRKYFGREGRRIQRKRVLGRGEKRGGGRQGKGGKKTNERRDGVKEKGKYKKGTKKLIEQDETS